MRLRLKTILVCVALCWAGTLEGQAGVSSRAVGRAIPPSTDPRAELLTIGTTRFGPDGRVYVAERAQLDIRVFDAAGKFVTNIGRAGAGPGEFRNITDFGWIGDTLWVVDRSLRRFTLFDRTFKVVRSFSTDVAGAIGSHIADVITPAGRFIQTSASDRNTVLPAPILRVTRDGRLLDTLALLSYGNAMVRAVVPATANRAASVFMVLQPFMDPPIWDIDPSGRWLAIANRAAPTSAAAARVEVRLYDLRTGTSRAMEMPFTPVPITKAMLDSTFASFTAVPTEVLRDVLYLPKFLPPIRSVVVSDDGGVWLQRRDGVQADTWIRLDSQGALTDAVRIPAAYLVTDARGRELLTVIRVADDVQPPVMIYSIVK